MRKVPALLAIVGLTIAGAALAIPATGDLAVRTVSLPKDASVGGLASAFLANSTEARLTGTVSHLHVIGLSTKWVKQHDASLQLPRTRNRQDSNFTNAHLEAHTTQPAAIVGGYPQAGGTFQVVGASLLESRGQGTIHELSSRVGTPSNSSDPTIDESYDVWSDSSIRTTSAGVASFSNAWQLKVRGFHITIDSDQGRAEFDTGWFADPVATSTVTWVVLDSPDLSLNITVADQPMIGVLPSAVASWHGEASVEGASGRLFANGAQYDTGASSGTISGALRADFAVKDDNGATALGMRLQGDMTDTTLATIRAPVAAPDDSAFPWTVVLGAAVVATIGTFTVATLRRSSSRDAAALDRIKSEAFVAMEAFQHARALELVTAARALQPEDAPLALWQATIHSHLGQTERALAAYDEASSFAPAQSDADYWAAVLLLRRNSAGDHDRALEHLERALARDPGLVNVVEPDEMFRPLYGPDFWAMIGEARGRAS